LKTDSSLDPEPMQIGIMTLYGFNPMANVATGVPTTLKSFIAISVVAVQYEIEGLLDTAFKAINNTLTKCLSHDDEDEVNSALEHFLGCEWNQMLNDGRFTPLMCEALRNRLYKINNKPVFKELLTKEPLLCRCLYEAMVEDEAQRPREKERSC